jgi:hypothetical protein
MTFTSLHHTTKLVVLFAVALNGLVFKGFAFHALLQSRGRRR